MFIPETSGINSGQTLDIADAEIIRFQGISIFELPHGYGTYGGREPDADWRREAERRIQSHRISPLTIEVVDFDGKAVSNAKNTLNLTQNEFGFGSLIDHDFIADVDEPHAAEYAQVAKELFDTVTVTMWWWLWDKNPKDWRQHVADTVNWIEANKMRQHGHVLVWETFDQGQLAESVKRAWDEKYLRGPRGAVAN